MPIAGMSDPVKTIELAAGDFPPVIKVEGSEDILYFDRFTKGPDGAIIEVCSVMTDRQGREGVAFEAQFPL